MDGGWTKMGRAVAWLCIVVGVAMVACGYAVTRTTLTVRTDLAEGQPKADGAQPKVAVPVEPPVVETELDDDEAAFQGELTSETATCPPTKEPETQAATEAALVRGAAMGTVVRLPNGQLALTWVEDGSGSSPTCYT